MAKLKAAFDATAALIVPAAKAALGQPILSPLVITDATAPLSPPSVPPNPTTSGSPFTTKAPAIMASLMRDFPFDTLQAAGILGNLGAETGGFRYFQEINPPQGVGGCGWAQWTGPRRRAFLAFCKRQDLEPTADEANYAFLKLELDTSESGTVPALRRTASLADAVHAFEASFERAGVKNYKSRERYAQIALDAYRAST